MNATSRNEKTIQLKKRQWQLVHHTRKLHLLELPLFNTCRFCSQKISGNFLKQKCCHQRCYTWGYKKTPYQKTYELQVGSQEFTLDFKECKRQFYWLEVSLVYDKIDKQTTIYVSYNAECVARMIKNIELSMKFDINNNT